jgi:flagellar biosynthesis/type III secretory pathway protein FliH
MEERKEGRKEGRKKGRKKGRKEGRKEEREDGRKEGKDFFIMGENCKLEISSILTSTKQTRINFRKLFDDIIYGLKTAFRLGLTRLPSPFHATG